MRSPTRTLKQLIHSIFKTLGYRLVRIGPSPGPASGLEAFFSSLKQHGAAPRHIIDVGANRGNWTRTALKYFPDAHYTLVEPQDHLKSYIQDLLDRGYKIQWINAGAADKSGFMPMSISSRDDSSTFVLIDRHGQTTGSQRTTIDVKTLNEIASASSAPPPDMVKIDAEGFDLNVLAGASDLLGKTDIFLVEAVVCGNYENSAAEVIKFMAAAGYRLIDITDLNRSPKHGILWLCELAFLRNASQLLDATTTYE
jgi:FkbM family methyltransferase